MHKNIWLCFAQNFYMKGKDCVHVGSFIKSKVKTNNLCIFTFFIFNTIN